MAHQKTVVLGVTGCIAAYKACEIVRRLQKAGVRVVVVMTEHACEFVAPLTFEALTHEPVSVGMFDVEAFDPIPHITLAQQADLMVIAPATANVVAKLANGIADDLLASTALAIHQPLLVAPAANVYMYDDASTQANLNTLRSRGAHIVEADEGYLACGDEGRGRLAEVETIVAAALEMLEVKPDLEDVRVLVTAGPTIEPIDPVRYISNYSSGKTGYALAEAARDRGAQVTLVSGPTAIPAPEGVTFVSVKTAEGMLAACQPAFTACDIAIFSAAVCDMRPSVTSDTKLKKAADQAALSHIDLVENPDIIATLASAKTNQVVVGYAAETNDVLEHARIKLSAKHADFIVANTVGEGIAFGTDDNQIWLVDTDGAEEIPRSSKDVLANVVLDKARGLMLEKSARNQ